MRMIWLKYISRSVCKILRGRSEHKKVPICPKMLCFPITCRLFFLSGKKRHKCRMKLERKPNFPFCFLVQLISRVTQNPIVFHLTASQWRFFKKYLENICNAFYTDQFYCMLQNVDYKLILDKLLEHKTLFFGIRNWINLNLTSSCWIPMKSVF